MAELGFEFLSPKVSLLTSLTAALSVWVTVAEEKLLKPTTLLRLFSKKAVEWACGSFPFSNDVSDDAYYQWCTIWISHGLKICPCSVGQNLYHGSSHGVLQSTREAKAYWNRVSLLVKTWHRKQDFFLLDEWLVLTWDDMDRTRCVGTSSDKNARKISSNAESLLKVNTHRLGIRGQW